MIIVLNADKLGYAASFNEKEGDVLTELRQKFMEKYSEDTYAKAAKIIIVEENFHNIIKDRYGPPLIGEHNDTLLDTINQHLTV